MATYDDEPKRGPANPQGEDGLEAPTPPGGPQRQDAASGSTTPGGPTPGPGAGESKPVAEGGDSPTIEPGHEGREPATAPGDLTGERTAENAETSEGEPSQ